MGYKDPEKQREYQRIWAAKRRSNPDGYAKMVAAKEKWNLNHKKERSRQVAEWKKRNPEKRREHKRRWYAKHRDIIAPKKADWKMRDKYGEFWLVARFYHHNKKHLKEDVNEKG